MTCGSATSTAPAESQQSARQMIEAIKCRLTTDARVSSADGTWSGADLSQSRSVHMLTQNYEQVSDCRFKPLSIE